MTYSKYEDYTDFQLNLEVIRDCINSKDLDQVNSRYHSGSESVSWADGANWWEFDGVNNARHLQPLIEEMIATGGFHMRSTNGGLYSRVIYKNGAFTDENWLRAIVICWLESKGE